MPPDDRGRGVAHRVVMDLCQPILNKGHHVYFDNYFTSPALVTELSQNQTGSCGTLRVNRVGVPAAVKAAKPNKGDFPEVNRDGNKLYITWHDKRLVNLLTTVHNGSTFTKAIKSRFHENHYREVYYPKAVQLYSMYMGGVDSADQQVQTCVSQHKMLKWWKKLAICNLLEVSVCNAKIIWKHFRQNERYRLYKFRLSLIHGLLDGYSYPVTKFARPVNNPSRRLTERHFPSLNPNFTPGGRRSSPDCEVCSSREEKKRHQTQHFCRSCNIPLCVYPCFERYHTLQNYKIVCSQELHK
jgi:hypothetical protein